MNVTREKISETILVTGGAGYIGSNLTHRLCNAGKKVVVIDDLSSGSVLNIPKNAVFIEGDINDVEFLRRVFLLHDIKLVFHFSAKKNVAHSVKNPGIFMQENVGSTSVLLKVMDEYECTKLVFASTAAVYGDREATGKGYLESDPLMPSNPYGLSKLIAEQRILENTLYTNLQVLVFRFFNVAMTEISCNLKMQDDLLSTLAYCIKNKEIFRVFGHDYDTPDGTCYRDFIHMTDLLDALEKSDAFLSGTSTNFTVFNLGSGMGISLREIASLGREIMGEDFLYALSERRIGDVAFSLSDISSSRKNFGWTPKVDSKTLFKGFFAAQSSPSFH